MLKKTHPMRRSYSEILLIMVTLVCPGTLQAERINSGIWEQQTSSLKQCGTCTLHIMETSPNMLEIKASQGWIGYVHYVPMKDEYHGFFELERGAKPPGKNWKKTLFTLKMILDHKTLKLLADSRHVRFQETYRFLKKVDPLPPPDPITQEEPSSVEPAKEAVHLSADPNTGSTDGTVPTIQATESSSGSSSNAQKESDMTSQPTVNVIPSETQKEPPTQEMPSSPPVTEVTPNENKIPPLNPPSPSLIPENNPVGTAPIFR